MNVTVKSGIPLKRRKNKRRVFLSHDEKRLVAKLLVSRTDKRKITKAFNISRPYLYAIQTEYVIITLTERYPDELQLHLSL